MIIDCISDLEKEIKKNWPLFHSLKMEHGTIHFSLETNYGLEWFPYYKAPISVEKYIRAWVKIS